MSKNSAESCSITQLLEQYQSGDDSVRDRLFELVYDELRVIAKSQLRRHSPDHTINTTALVHEAYINIAGADAQWNNRSRFFAFAARVMRNILVDHARARAAVKRTAEDSLMPISLSATSLEDQAVDILALDVALRELEEYDRRLSTVVECRFFGGMTSQETAEALGSSLRTVEREWSRARAYLYRSLNAPAPGADRQPRGG